MNLNLFDDADDDLDILTIENILNEIEIEEQLIELEEDKKQTEEKEHYGRGHPKNGYKVPYDPYEQSDVFERVT